MVAGWRGASGFGARPVPCYTEPASGPALPPVRHGWGESERRAMKGAKRSISDVIGVCAAAAILIAATSAPGRAGGFSRHHGHHFGHGHHLGHGGHLSLHGDGATAAVILGVGLLALLFSQPSARHDDPYAYRYRAPYRYRYRYPYRAPRSYVRSAPTIYAPPPARRLQPRVAQPRVAQLAARALAPDPALSQFPTGCLMIREYRTQIHHNGRDVEAYGDKCLQADGSWIKGVPKLVPE